MACFYRGSGVGTYWHQRDPRKTGFKAHAPNPRVTPDHIMNHIARGIWENSPFISLTTSFGVACSYAAYCGRKIPTEEEPGYVYQVLLSDPLPNSLMLIDPVKKIAERTPEPLVGTPYQHDGLPEFLIGVVSPTKMGEYLTIPYMQPPPSEGIVRTPNLTQYLETFVRALRDSEVLAQGIIPAEAIENRFIVFLDGAKIVTKLG